MSDQQPKGKEVKTPRKEIEHNVRLKTQPAANVITGIDRTEEHTFVTSFRVG